MAKQNIVITTKVEGLQAIEKLNVEIGELKKVSDKASKQVDKLKTKIEKDLARAAVKSTKKLDLLKAKLARDLSRAASKTTKKIDRLTFSFDRKLASAAAKSTKKLDRLEKKLDNLRASMRKTRTTTAATSQTLDQMGGQFSKVGGLGAELGGVFDALSVTTAGPLGLAIGGLTIGLGAVYAASQVVSASFERVIERAQETGRALTDLESAVLSSNARMEESYTNLQESFDTFVVEFGGGARKIDTEAAIYSRLGAIFDSLDGSMFKYTGLVQFYVLTLRDLGSTAVIAADNLDALNFKFGAGQEAADGFSNALDTLFAIHNEGVAALENGGMGSLIDGLGQSATTAAASFLDLASSIRDAVAEFDVGDIFDKVVDFVKDRKGKKPLKRRGGRPQRPQRPPGPKIEKSDDERASMRGFDQSLLGGPGMIESALQDIIDNDIIDKEAQARAKSRKEALDFIDKATLAEPPDLSWLTDLAEGISGLDLATLKAMDLSDALSLTTAPALQMVAEGMIQVGEATVQTMGAFAAGVGTLGEFGDSVLDMFSDLSSQIGSFFIKTGIGMAFISPVTGAGLIAAGLGLQFLSGALGAQGSGNAGGGKTSGGGGTGSSSAVTREIQRSLRGPDRGGQTTNIEVVIAGRAIEPEMVSIVDDMVRLRRSRTLGRMGA